MKNILIYLLWSCWSPFKTYPHSDVRNIFFGTPDTSLAFRRYQMKNVRNIIFGTPGEFLIILGWGDARSITCTSRPRLVSVSACERSSYYFAMVSHVMGWKGANHRNKCPYYLMPSSWRLHSSMPQWSLKCINSFLCGCRIASLDMQAMYCNGWLVPEPPPPVQLGKAVIFIVGANGWKLYIYLDIPSGCG